MEKETYKKAKEILEKYDPARFKDLEVKQNLTYHQNSGKNVILLVPGSKTWRLCIPT